jgi:hypothetical protein
MSDMKFLKGLIFVFGVMMLGASVKMKQGGDSPFDAFVCYGFFAISVLVAWSEITTLLQELMRKGR